MGDDDKRLDLLGRVDCSVLYQPFVMKLNELLNNCRARGQDYVATSGLRTYDEQNDLYARGRTKPGAKVTNAEGGYSPHNFGVAVDFAPHVGKYEGKLNPDYSAARYVILGEEAAKLGLEWGGGWTSIKDTPHIQLPLKSKGIDWATMRAWYANGGLSNVFKELDAWEWSTTP